VENPQDRLLELRYRGCGAGDSTTEPQRDPQTEASSVGNCDESLNVIDEPFTTFLVAVQREVDHLDVVPDQRELRLDGVSVWPEMKHVNSIGYRRPRESGGPGQPFEPLLPWVPAFARMTDKPLILLESLWFGL
jgi:hypothetical protein